MKRADLEIVVGNGHTSDRVWLRCWIYNNALAIGRLFRSGGWGLIHRRSGYTIIGGMRTLKEAHSVAAGVAPLADWSQSSGALTACRGLFAAALEVQRRVRAEHKGNSFCRA